LLALITSARCLSTFFTVTYLLRLRDEVYASQASTAALESELNDANAQVARSSHHLDVFTRRLIREQRAREQQLADLRARYDTLHGLSEGQERIAEAHRAILQQRTWGDRLLELGLGFCVGVLSSLVATVIWWALRKSSQMSPAEVASVESDDSGPST